MASKTTNLNLLKPASGDKFSITGSEGYNNNMDKIDAAIGQLNSDLKGLKILYVGNVTTKYYSATRLKGELTLLTEPVNPKIFNNIGIYNGVGGKVNKVYASFVGNGKMDINVFGSGFASSDTLSISILVIG